MAWEIESEEFDLAESEHRTTFIERSVTTRSGEPQRHLLQIRIGDHFTINDKGELLDNEGKVFDHRAKQQEILNQLNRQHANARAFARRHNIPIARGPKK